MCISISISIYSIYTALCGCNKGCADYVQIILCHYSSSLSLCRIAKVKIELKLMCMHRHWVKFTHTLPKQIFFKWRQWSNNATEIRSIRKAELQPALIFANTVESEEKRKFDTPHWYALTLFSTASVTPYLRWKWNGSLSAIDTADPRCIIKRSPLLW